MNNLITNLKEVILEAGELALTQKKMGLTVEYKSDGTPVTNADKKVSQLIYAHLTALTPDIPVICEERINPTLHSNTFWLVDPIDGTKQYIKGERTYTVIIGLIKNGEPHLGLIYHPDTLRLYYTDAYNELAIEEQGKKIDWQINYEQTIVIRPHYCSQMKNFLLKNQDSKVISVPEYNKLCLVASRKADVYPRFGESMEWDIAAGHALIKATGGNIVDVEGVQIAYGKKFFKNTTFFACGPRWLSKQTDHRQ